MRGPVDALLDQVQTWNMRQEQIKLLSVGGDSVEALSLALHRGGARAPLSQRPYGRLGVVPQQSIADSQVHCLARSLEG